jgi:hypothetical protein
MIKEIFRLRRLNRIRFHEEGAIQEQSMKLAYSNPATAAPEFRPRVWTDVRLCLEQCLCDIGHQPAGAARRLDCMFKRFARALEYGGDDLFLQARRLEESVAFIVAICPRRHEARSLQRNLTRLMHAVFRTPEWRRPFIQGL